MSKEREKSRKEALGKPGEKKKKKQGGITR